MNPAGGYRTRQREQILKFLMEHKNRHLSVDEVMDHLRGQGSTVGKSTVYRYLDRLVEQGTVRKYFLEEGMGACYQFSEDPAGCQQHFHLKCTVCGALIHVECPYLIEVAAHVLDHHGFEIDNTKTVFYGLCADCVAPVEGVPACKEK